MDKKFEFLEHTADAKFRAYGKTLEIVFINSAIAMYSIITDTGMIKPNIKKKFKLKAKKKESLLYDFLDEFIYFLDVDGFLLSKIEKLTLKSRGKDFLLECVALGDNYQNYEVTGNIKAMTYNDMFIKKEKDNFVIQAVVDL